MDISYNKQFVGIKRPYYLELDPTLTKSGYAADAKVAGMVVNLATAEADRASDEADRAERAASQASAAYKPLDSSWATSGTTFEFCEDVKNDDEATVGRVYVGKVYFSDLPSWLSQGECIVEIISDDFANGKAINLILSSGDTSPYHWEYNYVMINGTYTGTGWHSYIINTDNGINISSDSGSIVLDSGAEGGNHSSISISERGIQVDSPGSLTLQSSLNLYNGIFNADVSRFYVQITSGGGPTGDTLSLNGEGLLGVNAHNIGIVSDDILSILVNRLSITTVESATLNSSPIATENYVSTNYVPLPQTTPQADGKYMLVAQVDSGNITYKWEEIQP